MFFGFCEQEREKKRGKEPVMSDYFEKEKVLHFHQRKLSFCFSSSSPTLYFQYVCSSLTHENVKSGTTNDAELRKEEASCGGPVHRTSELFVRLLGSRSVHKAALLKPEISSSPAPQSSTPQRRVSAQMTLWRITFIYKYLYTKPAMSKVSKTRI